MTLVRVFLELLVVLTVHEFGHWLAAYVLRMPISSMTVGVGPLLFDLMGQKELQDLLDAAPPTKDPEELKIMEACRAVQATVREPVDG